MVKQVLIIQGGGDGAYEADGKLAAALRDALGAGYQVVYPKIPNEENPEYGSWKAQISIDEFTLHEGFDSQLPKGAPIFLYHSRDDEVVPFDHLAMYAEKLPQAIIRKIEGRGHQFNDDLSEVAADMASLEDLQIYEGE